MSKTEYTRKLEVALWELIQRWPDERGYDVAIGRARQLLLEGAIRFPSPGAGSDRFGAERTNVSDAPFRAEPPRCSMAAAPADRHDRGEEITLDIRQATFPAG